MKQLLSIIKKSFLWSYARNTWQWDVLCVLILIFIFLSPKGWFISGERRGPLGRNEARSTVTVAAEGIDNDNVNIQNTQLEQRIRIRTGRPNAQVVGTTPIKDSTGKTVAYEVDFR